MFQGEQTGSALRKSWSLKPARQWTLDNLAAGQWSVAALLVHEPFGGELSKTQLPEGRAPRQPHLRSEVFFHRLPICGADQFLRRTIHAGER